MISALRKSINTLPRRVKQAILVSFDAAALLAVLWLSYSLRLGVQFRPNDTQLALMALAPALALPVFLRMGLYRAVIRYLPDRAIWTVLKAMVLATLIWVFVLFLAEVTRVGVLPRSIPVFYFLLGTLVIGGSRFAARSFLGLPLGAPARRGEAVIYGAGRAGGQLATALRTQDPAYVAAFLDDDKTLQGRDVMGLRVYAPENLDALIANLGVREVLISLPSIDGTRRREIVAALSRHPVKIRALPAISDLASGKYLVSQLREIDIDDLLGRSSVPADPQLLGAMLAGRVVMVSGAGGSIGSELTRLIVKWQPARLVLLEANEYALYQIERRLAATTGVPLVPVLGSVTDAPLVRRTLAAQGVEVVFHAAAHKHVPLVERNALEGVRNNVLGTSVIAEAALAAGVESFVLISTDKAVRPTNVMGATKRWAELIVGDCARRAAAAGSGQRFSAVRFGNVLGSNGSVVPLFREQIAAGGPVTVTDRAMTRYFMSIHEAAELIVQAGALSEAGGAVFLLEMGAPVRIADLAENMVRLAGLTVRDPETGRGDIAITEIGARPGEKLFEELFYDPAHARPTRQPRILRATMAEADAAPIGPALEALSAALGREDEAETRKLLFERIADNAPK